MATDRYLINYLPHFMQEFLELRKVMEAEQLEMDQLWTAAENVLADQFIMDATEYGVARWESMLGISPKATDTLDERKFRILTQINQDLPYTVRSLEQTLTNLCGADGYSMVMTAAEYHIEVKLAISNKSNYGEVEKILKKMVPANMTQYIQIMYNTYSQLETYTHDQLATYTHEQLRIEVI